MGAGAASWPRGTQPCSLCRFQMPRGAATASSWLPSGISWERRTRTTKTLSSPRWTRQPTRWRPSTCTASPHSSSSPPAQTARCASGRRGGAAESCPTPLRAHSAQAPAALSPHGAPPGALLRLLFPPALSEGLRGTLRGPRCHSARARPPGLPQALTGLSLHADPRLHAGPRRRAARTAGWLASCPQTARPLGCPASFCVNLLVLRNHRTPRDHASFLKPGVAR